jgi:hypothetical protein
VYNQQIQSHLQQLLQHQHRNEVSSCYLHLLALLIIS